MLSIYHAANTASKIFLAKIASNIIRKSNLDAVEAVYGKTHEYGCGYRQNY